jgi:N-terminal domain of galactosyltransferase
MQPRPLSQSVIIPADTKGLRETQLVVVVDHVQAILPDAEIVIPRGRPGPFNKSAVCNAGALKATHSTLIFLDSDMLHPAAVLKRAVKVRTWGIPSSEVHNLRKGQIPGGRYDTRPGTIPGRGGLFAFHRDAFERVGGFDEGFIGWGCEDEALFIVARRLLGEPEDLGSEPSWHLYHEPQPERLEVRRNLLAHNRQRLAELKPGGYMRVQVVNTSDAVIPRAGFVFNRKQTHEITVSNEHVLREIRACRHLKVTVLEDRMTPPPGPTDEKVPFMEPPRYLHSCGFVARSAAGLAAHKRHCK